jgi:hypothetical protein
MQIGFALMSFAEDFQRVLDSMPPDWTDLELDLRIDEESRYIDTAVMLSQVNAQPYSRSDWHWRLLVAHSFGHAAAAPTVKGVLGRLDAEGVRCARDALRWSRCGADPRAFAKSFASAARFSGPRPRRRR